MPGRWARGRRVLARPSYRVVIVTRIGRVSVCAQAASIGWVVVRGLGSRIARAREGGVDELAVVGEVHGGEDENQDACDEEPGELGPGVVRPGVIADCVGKAVEKFRFL